LTAPMVGQDTLTVTSLRQPGELIQAGDVVAEFDTTQTLDTAGPEYRPWRRR
jgi:hypothetical protein